MFLPAFGVERSGTEKAGKNGGSGGELLCQEPPEKRGVI